MTTAVTLVIVEDHQVMLDGLRLGLGALPGIQVVGGASSFKDGLELCRSTMPDVVLLDLHLPDSNGPKSLAQAFVGLGGPRIVIFSAEDRQPIVKRLLEMGVSGFVSKSESLEKVACAIREAGQRESTPAPKSQAASLAPSVEEHKAITEDPELSGDGEELEVMDAENDPNLGTIINERYRLVSLLGVGGYSTVYKAERLDGNDVVAVKILHGHLVRKIEIVKRFRREAQATQKLVHPNICQIIEFGATTDHIPYIAMAYEDGLTLDVILDSYGRMTERYALPLFTQLCDGVQFAHEKGILHRDIKPGNVIVTRDNDVKILDFGLAKATQDAGLSLGASLTGTGNSIGTPAYMSPEQCLGEELDARSDVYAMGCLMFEVMTGKALYQGNSSFEVMTQHVKGKKDLTPLDKAGISPMLRSAITKALALEPEARFHTVSALKSAIESCTVPSQS